MDKCGIYKITNLINGKIYIGQSRFIQRRFDKHKSEAKNNNPLPLYNAIRKYGIDNFKFEIIEECLPDELNNRETYYMFFYNSFVPNGYNIKIPCEEGYYIHIPDYVYEIYDDLKNTNLTYDEIGIKYNLSGSHIFAINYGRSWRLQEYTYPIRKKYGDWDSSQVIPLLKQGLTTKDIANRLNTTKGTIESYMYMNNIKTSDYRKRLTSNRTIQRQNGQEYINYKSIKEAGIELSQLLSIDENTAICGIKRALKGNHKYKGYSWYYIDNRNGDIND